MGTDDDRAIELAREIRRTVERFADDVDADPGVLEAALDALPRRELADMARAAFDRLDPIQQWSVLERLLGEGGVLEALDTAQRGRLSSLRRAAAAAGLVADVVDGDRLDVAGLPGGTRLTLWLFRPEDVDAARSRGRDSDVCARRIQLVATDVAGRLQVVDDDFNPRGGLFVTGEYDRAVWATERLDDHALVAVGAAGPDGIEPVAVRGSRLDVEHDGVVQRGRLHLGWATVDDVDAFSRSS